ncbi:MAG: hypothetical protein NC489_09005 [Ruminococcus flavefaciens]|nr:hypothetical protein [Ruminococcus flavefaciens]
MGLFNRKKGQHEITEKEMTQFQMRLAQTLATTSKQLIWFFSINGVIWIWCSYILAFLGREQIAESLSSTVCEIIVGSLVAYLVTSTVENVFKFNSFGGRIRSREKENDDTSIIDDISQVPPD